MAEWHDACHVMSRHVVLQEAYAELAQLEASFRSRADSSQAALEKLVESKERREQELYIKVAILKFWCAC